MSFASLFPRNEHIIDRVLRVIVGIALLAIVFVGPQTPLGWIGIVPLFTGLVGSCPLYRITGICTLPKSQQQ
ncbi:MAG: DUF2892 domain-containing protein [Deltaproteobacteria bacterium]|nr:DUF2892 domain-containing protein [Deltaproteobacteria bacterium]